MGVSLGDALRAGASSAADFLLYTMVSGIWNVSAAWACPFLALLVLLSSQRPVPG